MAQWNANGLQRHIEEIKIFLKYNHIDVLLISETHCTERTYCYIPQYNIYYTNHPDATAHAGTALIIWQTISHYELPSFKSMKTWRFHMSEKLYLIRMQNIIKNWKYTPIHYYTRYWTSGSQDDWSGPGQWTCYEEIEVPSLDAASSCH